MASIDRSAVRALAQERIDWRHKAMPADLWGLTLDEVRERRPRMSQLPTPLLTLSRAAMDHNLSVMAGWCAARGLDLAPHGKTTMAPQLWAEQLAAGAWAITVANQSQLQVARAFGIDRVMVANTLIAPSALRQVARDLAAHPEVEIYVWADAVRTIDLMHEVLAEQAKAVGEFPAVQVLVERGGAGGRTGARDLNTCLDIARAIDASPHLRLAGVAGYEGAMAHHSDEQSRAVVRGYLEDLVDAHRRLEDLGIYDGAQPPIVTAGGSAYFDVVEQVLHPLTSGGARVVLRSGAYLVHDDGFYRYISPLGSHPRLEGPVFRSAMHGWVRVTSQPEPGLALADAGKRDLPYDEGLPEVQRLRPRDQGGKASDVSGVEVTALNDQHLFLTFDEGQDAPVRVGDELRLGLSHPCTAFDKWKLIPVIDDADLDDPTVVDLVRTWF